MKTGELNGGGSFKYHSDFNFHDQKFPFEIRNEKIFIGIQNYKSSERAKDEEKNRNFIKDLKQMQRNHKTIDEKMKALNLELSNKESQAIGKRSISKIPGLFEKSPEKKTKIDYPEEFFKKIHKESGSKDNFQTWFQQQGDKAEDEKPKKKRWGIF